MPGKPKVGMTIHVYVDDDGVTPNGESYLEVHGALANRLGSSGLAALNGAVPWGRIHDAVIHGLKVSSPPDRKD